MNATTLSPIVSSAAVGEPWRWTTHPSRPTVMNGESDSLPNRIDGLIKCILLKLASFICSMEEVADLGRSCHEATDYCTQGVRMDHGVGNGVIIPSALAGTSFLIHVVHSHHHATMEMTTNGEVADVYHSNNSQNGACAWARWAVTAWRKSTFSRIENLP